MNAGEIAMLIGASLGSAGLGGAVVKYMNRGVDAAEAASKRADASASEVGVLREIIAEVRDSDARKTQRLEQIEQRVDKLEERERHMLTRAAVHEAWDQLAFAALVAQNPQHPPPPPLSLPGELEDDQP